MKVKVFHSRRLRHVHVEDTANVGRVLHQIHKISALGKNIPVGQLELYLLIPPLSVEPSHNLLRRIHESHDDGKVTLLSFVDTIASINDPSETTVQFVLVSPRITIRFFSPFLDEFSQSAIEGEKMDTVDHVLQTIYEQNLGAIEDSHIALKELKLYMLTPPLSLGPLHNLPDRIRKSRSDGQSRLLLQNERIASFFDPSETAVQLVLASPRITIRFFSPFLDNLSQSAVEGEKMDTVGHVLQTIYEQNHSDLEDSHIALKELKLYILTPPLSFGPLRDLPDRIRKSRSDGQSRLLLQNERIASFFDPSETAVQLILVSPRITIQFFSPFLNNLSQSAVEGEKMSIVEHVLQTIYEQNHSAFEGSHISLKELKLYLLTPPLSLGPLRDLPDRICKSRSDGQSRLLLPNERIASLFDPLKMSVQLVLELEQPKAAEKVHLETVSRTLMAAPPSHIAKDASTFKDEQKKHPIYNGRPDHNRSTPIVAYHPAFAKLHDQLQDLAKVEEPEPCCISRVAKLFLSAADIYETEREREHALFHHINLLLGINLDPHDRISPINYGPMVAGADGMATVQLEDATFGAKRGVYAVLQLKNEPGSGGDGAVQAALTFRVHVAQDEYEAIRNISCCPCILVSIAGPYISFFGAIFVDVIIVQHFTEYIYLGGNPYASQQVTRVAKVFTAVANALETLKQYYHTLIPSRTPLFARLFPNPVDRKNLQAPALEGLEFTERLRFKEGDSDTYRRSLFLAELKGVPVFVKFCESYNQKAHELLAAENFAPKLYFCDKICEGITMVVMARIEGCDAYNYFGGRAIPEGVMRDVEKAISILHGAGIVFGDLRRPNIMITEDTEAASTTQEGLGTGTLNDKGLRVALIDFDWAGIEGQARYSVFLNDSGQIKWARGVEPGGIMRKQHDLDMLQKLKNTSQ